MMRAAGRLAALAAILLSATRPGFAAEIAVAPGPDALVAAIRTAAPGDVLRLGDGTYAGPVTIDKPLTLAGGRDARITGPGRGSVITVAADDVTLEGLAVSGSGLRLDTLDSGIVIAKDAMRTKVLRNRIVGNLIGIDVQGGRDALVEGNTIVGRIDLRKNERGPGIYVWNAPGLVVAGNDIRRGRDGVFISTSAKAVYRGNRFRELRFAFHAMYANDIEVRGNLSEGNDLGFAFMFSRRVRAEDNRSIGDRSHGLFLNAVNDSVIAHNTVARADDKCLFFYDANKNRIEANRFEGCGIGIHFTAGSEKNVFTGNAFVGNRTQVKYVGSRWLEWSDGKTGNYWSDHAAFDVNGDGIADSPYRPNDVIDQLTWSQPMARLLLGAPAVQLIRWSQSRFPGLMPGGVVDSRPLMGPGTAGARPQAALVPAAARPGPPGTATPMPTRSAPLVLSRRSP
jgi:nitrous oxidase accessory protein